MNDKDRKTLDDVKKGLSDVNASLGLTLLEELHQEIDVLREAEQGKYDNLSEGLQTSEKGETLQQNADALSKASSRLDNAEQALVEAFDEIESCISELGNIV